MVVVVRRALPSVLLLSSLLLAPAAAQDAPAFLLLGEDPTGDPNLDGVPMIDTWIDINSLSVATVGTDLVFHLGLQGTTTEAGSYCWMAAFEVDGEEFVGLDCYEGIAYESDNTASGASAPSTSRGTNVASSVVFDATGAVITIPLAAIGADIGTTIDDIYGLTYATRALIVVDTIPDAKSSVDADESLGSYVIGGGAVGGSLENDAILAAQNITENLTAPAFLHEFANATSDDYTLNFTVPWANASLLPTASVVAGSANVTVRNNGTVVYSALFTNATHPAGNATDGNATAPAGNATGAASNATQPLVLGNATGNWTVTVDYEGFVGTLGLNVTEHVAPPPATVADVEADAKDSPGLGLPLLALAVVGLAVGLRRRRA